MSDERWWLVKDFHVLYRAAKAATESAQRGVFITNELVALHVHLDRLRPAFNVCEYEHKHHGIPQRLTPAERKALAALHRWLHSPIGDDVLTEEAADYHEQVEAESAAECARLQAEEDEAYAAFMRDDAIDLAKRKAGL